MKNLHILYFSPTGGTEKVAKLLEKELALPSTFYDLTTPDKPNLELTDSDLALFVLPSFAGRCPQLALERMQNVIGNNTKAILVTVFGNRDIDDTLLELKDVVITLGFTPIAALATVAKHSIFPMFASDRPDSEDEMWIKEVACKIKEKLEAEDNNLTVPGNYPYKALNPNPLKPIVEVDKCTKCRLCANTCPALAINKVNPASTDYDLCISCMRCINICPVKARYLDQEKYNMVYNRLRPGLKDRKDNLLFL